MRLHAHEWGDRHSPPLVCLHGVTGHGRRFRKLVEERLAPRFRVLSLDLRGHGRSGWEPPWDIATHVEDVVETLTSAGVERASWLGHSFGGRLVLEVAAARPGAVERAVLLDPALTVAPGEGLARAEEERADKSYGTVEEAIERRIETGPLFSTPREVLAEEMREHLVRSPDGRLRYRYCQSAVVTGWSEMATAPPPFASVPTLVVLGAESWLSVAVPADRDVEVVTVPGGHIVYWDAFEETADAVESFLGRNPASSKAAWTSAS